MFSYESSACFWRLSQHPVVFYSYLKSTSFSGAPTQTASFRIFFFGHARGTRIPPEPCGRTSRIGCRMFASYKRPNLCYLVLKLDVLSAELASRQMEPREMSVSGPRHSHLPVAPVACFYGDQPRPVTDSVFFTWSRRISGLSMKTEQLSPPENGLRVAQRGLTYVG